MAVPEIIFYFESASSYSYIGFEFMERYKKLWDVKVDYRPFNLMQVMANAKNKFSPYKLPFLFTDLKRTSAITKIPFRGTPKQYPYDPTTALRTLQFIKTQQPEKMPEAMRRLWNMEYVQLVAPATPELVKQALEGVVDPS
ncbi:Glutathione S-transferase kappa 1, partial [Linderina pennispora]